MWRRSRGQLKADDPTVSQAPDRSRSSHQAHLRPRPAREIHSPRPHLDAPHLVGAAAARRLPRGDLRVPLARPRRSALPAGLSRQGLKQSSLTSPIPPSPTKALGESCDHQTWIKWQALAKTGGLDGRNEAHRNVLRFALLDFIADFANWDNSTVPEYLETSRALTQAAHEAFGGEPGTRPLVVDPFAGGGSIPLEALRVGADAFASDLNPVAVLLNKVVLEYIPKYGQRLADEVRKWGEWIKQEAEKELAEFYPKGCGWRDADGVSLGADDSMRRPWLRSGSALDSLALAGKKE